MVPADERETIDDETQMDIRVVEASISPWVDDLRTNFPYWPDEDDGEQPPTFTQAREEDAADERFRELCDDSGLAADLIIIVLEGIDTDLETDPVPEDLFQEARNRIEAEDDSLTVQLIDIALRYLLYTDSNNEDDNRKHAAAIKDALSQPEASKEANEPAKTAAEPKTPAKPGVPPKPSMPGEGGAEGGRPGALRKTDGTQEQPPPPEKTPPEATTRTTQPAEPPPPTPPDGSSDDDLKAEPRYVELLAAAQRNITKARAGEAPAQLWLDVTVSDLRKGTGVGSRTHPNPIYARLAADGTTIRTGFDHRDKNARARSLLVREIQALVTQAGLKINRLR